MRNRTANRSALGWGSVRIMYIMSNRTAKDFSEFKVPCSPRHGIPTTPRPHYALA